MENQLRAWLRYCIFFGVYLNASNESANQTTPPPPSTLEAPRIQRNNQAWLENTKAYSCNFFLQRFHVCFLLSTLCGLYIHGLYWRDYIPELMLTWIAATMIFTSQVGTNFFIIMEAVCKRSQHEAFLVLLDEIEVALKLRLRQDVQPIALVKNVRTSLLYLVTLSLLALGIFIVTSMWLNYIGYFWHGLWSILTMRVRIIQLVIYVRTLRHYLECLCVKLRQIVAYRMAPEQRLLDIDYEKLESLEYLLAIKEIYALLHKAFQLLNNFAGWSLFSITVCYLFDFTCNMYWTLLSLDGYARRRYYYIAGPASMIPLIVIVGHLCYLCDNCKKLGHTVAHLLCKIMVTNSAKSLNSYRLVLYQFSSQLQLQCIEVTAQHFYALEMHLLVTMFTAVSMNLVILIQFLSS
ncbi:putative gustatory receptor 39b [Anastrepha ludens]|uniref:putative gustatory receptor 39b n=1 Tax=Anastrepha ludens TaxID=28586 RepID=UPI0023AF1381|nr:putative gustatory receptor 39b [Anastrepha ludens]